MIRGKHSEGALQFISKQSFLKKIIRKCINCERNRRKVKGCAVHFRKERHKTQTTRIHHHTNVKKHLAANDHIAK